MTPWWAFLLAEVRHRRRLSIVSLLMYVVAVTLIVVSSGIATSLREAEDAAIRPLTRLDSNLYLTRRPPDAGTPDATAFAVEREQTRAASVLDLSKLGPTGQRFSSDFFLPATAFTFDVAQLGHLSLLTDVQGVSPALTLRAVHREGTVPAIVAQYVVQPATVALARPRAEDQAIINACLIKFIQSLPKPTGPPPPKGAYGVGIDIPFTSAYYACLPARLRQVRIEEQVFREILAPPTTNIRDSTIEVAGIDPKRAFGILTRGDLVDGRWFDGDEGHQVIASASYAARMGLSVGSPLQFHETSLRVVALVKPALKGLSADIYLPLNQLQAMSGRDGRVNLAVVAIRDSESAAHMRSDLERKSPGFAVYTPHDVAGQVTGTLADTASLAQIVGSALMVLVAAASMAACGLFSAAGMRGRRPELAMLRVIGWSLLRTRVQLVAEQMVVVLAGVGVGASLGAVVLGVVAMVAPTLSATIVPPAVGEYSPTQLATVSVRLNPHIDPLASLAPIALIVLATAVAAFWATSKLRSVSARDLVEGAQ